MAQQPIPQNPLSSPSGMSRNPLEKQSLETEGFKSFSSLMQPSGSLPEAETGSVSPLQLAQIATAGPVNPAALLDQLTLAQSSFLNIQEHIQNPKLKLTTAQKNLIKSKLTSANSQLESAHLKLGGTLDQQNEDAAGPPSKGAGPISQFLGYLTNGLNQLESTKQHVKAISTMGLQGQLSPGDFLLIQIKLAKAQQELEFTGVLLSKTIDGFKQIMSVQL